MTRVNVVPPFCLYDQHLLAEMREIPRVVNLVKKLLETKGSFVILDSVGSEYTLGKGHVNFFKNKLLFIKERHDALKLEAIRRGLKAVDFSITLDNIPDCFLNNYKPTKKDIEINLSRLQEKINLKPSFYRYK